jgi:hypothetical protein
MSFQKFVHRSTKGIFLFIAIMMVIPLVLWGYMGPKGGGEKDGEESVGVIFDTIHISKREWNEQKLRAHPSYYWRMVRLYPRMAGHIPEPKPEEVVQQARKNVVLLQDAKDKGIPNATKGEMQRKLQDIWFMFTGGRVPLTEQNEEMLARSVFRATVQTFEGWIEDQVVIEKLLTMMSAGEFADYDKVYDRLMSEQQSVRVTFAAIDPAEYVREVKPPRTEEIAKYYEANKAKFKTPDKARVEYLLADVDEIKKKAPEPTEAEVKKYYEDNKNVEFLKSVEHKEHEHAPGEEHKDDEKPAAAEPKSFAEVQAEIPDRIKRKWAMEHGGDAISGASKELGAIYLANNSKYPDTVFDDLEKKFDPQKGVKLTHDVTPLFDSRRLEEIEKIVGANSMLGSWAFDPKTKVGDITMTTQTTKGKALFKLIDRKPAEENPGVTVQNREAIVKELQKEQVRKRVGLQASTIVEEIKVHGMAATRLKYPLEWRSSRYFTTDFNGEPGIEDRALGSAIRSRIAQSKPKAGEAMVLQGSAVGREKQDWAYVVYVDDVLSSPPEDMEAKFQETRRQMDTQAREQYQENYTNQMVFRAVIRGLEGKDGGAVPVPPPMHDDDGN